LGIFNTRSVNLFILTLQIEVVAKEFAKVLRILRGPVKNDP